MIASAILADAAALISAGLPRAFAIAECFDAHTCHLPIATRDALRRLLIGA